MPKQVIHNATITLKLPLNMSAEAEAAALHAAGIPVDAIGNAASGFLFVRSTMDWKNPTKIFRWFATDIGQVAP
ncbi:hypothetical protein [Variovorax sp. PAMC26660]|uniref:hypothetical protein n=1 Tax=Variovorax sp. PAMC26660 TaxID=2762322 RepID=UPI00164D4696|nr:hypothetical protein [Variovorax sp. PAMC26660]QNK67232.1 hypothetical protein H7F35_29440 [Variovorax sp. PAMC26660]